MAILLFVGYLGLIVYNLLQKTPDRRIRIPWLLAIGILVLYFALTSPGAAVASWMVYLVAAWLLVSSLLELLEIWMLKRSGYESFGVTTSALVSLAISLIMFLFPVMINNAVFMAVGIIMIVIAVFLIIWAVRMILFERRLKEEARKSETDWEEL